MDLQQVEKNVIATIVGAIGIGIGTATQSAQGQGFCYEKPPFERCPPRSNALVIRATLVNRPMTDNIRFLCGEVVRQQVGNNIIIA
jgi:hypothetical protein